MTNWEEKEWKEYQFALSYYVLRILFSRFNILYINL